MAANSAYFKVDAPISVSSVESDTISEKTSAAGVTVDGCLIKDGRAAALATASFFMSEPVTGNGAAQNTAHGFGTIPTLTYAVPVDLTSAGFELARQRGGLRAVSPDNYWLHALHQRPCVKGPIELTAYSLEAFLNPPFLP